MDGAYQRMLESLRDNFGKRLPAGLSPAADSRLQRTLGHYVREVIRVQGSLNEQEVLRETFDSMAGWFRRNTGAIRGSPPVPAATPLPPPPPSFQAAVSPEPALSFAVPLEEQDPIALFERIKATRAAAAGAPIPTVSTPIPQLPAELQPLETRPVGPVTGLPPGFAGIAQPKDFVQRQEDIVKYRETEYNLILNSKDRDWLAATTENRYRFTVQLDSVARPQGTGAQATITNRFRNIVRLEFIKAVIPVEGLEVAVPRDCAAAAVSAPEQAPITALSLPFIQVMLEEHQANNYSTNPTADKSFAICQYDATWRSDATTGGSDYINSRGYTLFSPKFMKAQRVYAPAPLASLNKLSFELLNPENLTLSPAPDALRMARVIWGSDPDVSGSCYDTSGSADVAEYLFIETTTWFSLWTFGRNDRVAFKDLTFTSATPSIQKAGEALNQWLERDEGHIVVGIGYYDASSGAFVDGWNDCGYANTVILRNRFVDPTTGVCARYLWTGAAGTETTLADEMAAYNAGATAGYQRGGILNLSRQVQLFLRVITRDVDPGSSTRPDNV